MTSYTVLTALATVLCTASPSTTEASLVWTRAQVGAAITIDAVPAGTDMALAQADVQATAVLLDAVRSVKQHVVWQRIAWEGGRMVVDLVADSALYANVATLALRRQFPGRSTAGTGIRQARRVVVEGYGWTVRFVLAARQPSRTR